MADAKKKDEKQAAVPTLPGGSASASPQLPRITLSGGGAPGASGVGGLFAGTAGKIITTVMLSALGVGAAGLMKVLRPTDQAQPLSLFANHPPVTAATGDSGRTSSQDGVQVTPPPELAGSASGGAQTAAAAAGAGAGGAASDAAPASAAAGAATSGVKDAPISPRSPSLLITGNAAATMPVPQTNFKPGGPSGAGSGGSSGASLSAASAPAVPVRASEGAAKALGSSGTVGKGGSAISSAHGRGALKQLMMTAGSSRLGAASSGEASAAAAGRNFDNASAIGGSGARPMGGAGTGQAPTNKKGYNGGAPINTNNGAAPQAPPVAGHKDVTPWGQLVVAATFVLLGAGILLFTASTLAAHAKTLMQTAMATPDPVTKASILASAAHFYTAAQVCATIAGLAGLAAIGIGAKVLSMGGQMQGIGFIAGGAIVTVLAVKALFEEHDAKAEVATETNKNQPLADKELADKQALKDQLADQKMREDIPANHMDDVHHMSTEKPVKMDVASHEPTPLEKALNAKAPEPNSCVAPPSQPSPTVSAPKAPTDIRMSTNFAEQQPGFNGPQVSGPGSTASGFTPGGLDPATPVAPTAAPQPALAQAPAAVPEAPAPAPQAAPAAPPPEAPVAPAAAPAPAPAAPAVTQAPATMFNSPPPTQLGSGSVAANQSNAFDELGQGEASGLHSYTEHTTNVNGHIETNIETKP